uniref:Uncharacterized protein n=1 Tax=Setaria italica TaxID=4555 RepID=K3Y102_SETIT
MAPVRPQGRPCVALPAARGREDGSVIHPIQGAYVQAVPISNEDGERSIGRSAVGAGSYRDSRRKKKEQEEQWVMLILELGIWVLPFTLLLAPARRMVRLVAELQRIFLAVACRRAPPPTLGEVWSRLDRLDSAIVVP